MDEADELKDKNEELKVRGCCVYVCVSLLEWLLTTVSSWHSLAGLGTQASKERQEEAR